MSFDRAAFYLSARKSTLFDGTLSVRQVQGIEAILDAWDKSGFADERWLAYALGTTYHETGRAMFPVREGGLGKGHPYGVKLADGQIAYGRGFVQLTWEGPAPRPMNYAKADAALDLRGKLVADFDEALDPPIAAQILLRGMAEGWFTGFKLGDYLNDHLADYLHARRIVNGMDQADKIAAYALVFFAAIMAGEHKGADHTTAAAPAKPAPAPAALDPISAIVSGLGQAADTIGSVIAPTASGPSPAPASAPSATPTAESTDPMEGILAIVAEMFTGVAGKISVASTVATALPTVVEGTIKNISEAPKVVAEIEALVADVKAGKWSNTPADVHALLAEFEVILSNYGVNLSALTSMVSVLPSTPAVTAAPTAVKSA